MSIFYAIFIGILLIFNLKPNIWIPAFAGMTAVVFLATFTLWIPAVVYPALNAGQE